jgi:hypothetical protein
MISPKGLNLIGFLAFILVFVNMFLMVSNQSLQRAIADRQQFLVRSLQMQATAREVITAMANLAVRTDDEPLKQVLTSHGINVTVNSSGSGPAKR